MQLLCFALYLPITGQVMTYKKLEKYWNYYRLPSHYTESERREGLGAGDTEGFMC